MKPIIVPVNFSPCSHDAALYAADLAQAMKSDLHLLHVVGVPFSTSEVAMTNFIFQEMVQAANDSLKELQVDLTRHTHGKVRVGINLEVGNLEASLRELCQKLEPYAVVLGSTGPTVEKFLVGSPITSLLQHLHTPVIVVPEKANFRRYNRVLLACDPDDLDSGLSQHLPLLKKLRDLFDTHFDIVTIDTNKSSVCVPAEIWPTELKDLRVRLHLIHASKIEEGIEQYIGNHEVDLVLVFPKRHSLLDFHISQSRKLTRNSAVPVMSLHE